MDHYKLMITFLNGEEKLFDVIPYLNFPVYEVLRDSAFFRMARVFNGTVIWNEDIDFAPETLYFESVQVTNAVKLHNSSRSH